MLNNRVDKPPVDDHERVHIVRLGNSKFLIGQQRLKIRGQQLLQ